MGVKIIRDATCDRCGKKCSHITTRVLDTRDNAERKYVENNIYKYTEVILKGFDGRFSETPETSMVLCGKCLDSLEKWLKNQVKGE